MYANDQPIIGDYAVRHPDNLARVIQFALMSARVHFFNVPAVLYDAETGAPGVLYGHKMHAYQRAWIDRETNFEQCSDIILRSPIDLWERNMVLYLSQLPGLGLIKAGFVSQLAFGLSGCIDTVNSQRFGIDARMFSQSNYRPKQIRTLKGKIKAVDWYNAKCRELGGTETLWDEWCQFIATKYDKHFKSADAVSSFHLDILHLDRAA